MMRRCAGAYELHRVTRITCKEGFFKCLNKSCVCRWESLVLILMYAVYILMMKWVSWKLQKLAVNWFSVVNIGSCVLLRFNGKAHRYFSRRKKGSGNLANGLTGSTDLEDNVSYDATAVLLKKGTRVTGKNALMWVSALFYIYKAEILQKSSQV